MHRIVRRIVECGHGTVHVEILHEHAFLVEVGKSHGALYAGHALPAAPLLHGFQQRARHFVVIGEFKEAEPHVAGVPLLVDPVVDDADDASCGLSVGVSDEWLDVAAFQFHVFLRGERVSHV